MISDILGIKTLQRFQTRSVEHKQTDKARGALANNEEDRFQATARKSSSDSLPTMLQAALAGSGGVSSNKQCEFY